ncbi:MAG: hypothetical protein WA774_24385 [Candidatus Acidiferrales bacterium]
MKKLAFLAIVAAVTMGVTSCGTSAPDPAKPASTAATPAAPATPPIPDDIQKAAERSLGSETEVLLYGDLAKNGEQEVLAINRMKQNPKGGAPGTVVTRAVILQKDAGGTWKEVLRCDEHLENPKGYLGNIPLAPVNGWRLQYEQDAQKGLQLYFTPVSDPNGARALPIEVRWNSKVKRYQSLDRNFENFLGELPSLETPESQIHL